MSAPEFDKEKIDGEWTFEKYEVLWSNLSGTETNFNAKGQRNFWVIIPEDRVQELLDVGFNVKYTDFHEVWVLKVNIDAREKRPWFRTPLVLDGYSWEYNGKTGVMAYMQYTPEES